MRFPLIILLLLGAASLNGQISAIPDNKHINVEEYPMFYWYRTCGGKEDLLKIPGDSSEYLLLYMTSNVIGVMNQKYFELYNDSIYGFYDTRRYGNTENPYLHIDDELKLYEVFKRVFSKRAFRIITHDMKQYLRSVDFGGADWLNEKEGKKKNTLNDWLLIYGADFFNIYVGLTANNEIKMIYFRFQNLDFFRELSPDRFLKLEKDLLETISFTTHTQPPPDGKINLYLFALDLNRLIR